MLKISLIATTLLLGTTVETVAAAPEFWQTIEIGTTYWTGQIVAGDFNGDGNVDLATPGIRNGSAMQGSVDIYENTTSRWHNAMD